MTSLAKGVWYAIIGFFCFSFADVIAKFLAKDGYGSFQISFLFSLAATVCLLACSPWLGGLRSTLDTRQRKLQFLRAALSAPTQAMFFYGISRLPLSTAYAVVFLAPFLTAWLAVPVLGERATLRRWLLIAAGFAGVLVAVRPETRGIGWPVLAVAFVACCTAGRNVLVAKMGSQETPLSLALFPSVAIVAVTTVPALAAWKPVSAPVWVWLALAGVVFGFGLLLNSLAFRYAPASIAAPFHYTQIIWGVLAGLLFFNHIPDVWTLIGCVIIVLSGTVLVRLRSAKTLTPVQAEPTIPAR